MDRTLRVLLIDDESARLKQWRHQIELLPEMANVEVSESSDISKLFTELGERREQVRKNSHGTTYSGSTLDDTDIVVIDHDLGPRSSSGAEVAYLARCYSGCGLIVLMNSIVENVFDLHLHPTMDLFADVELGSRQLSNPGLWGRRWPEFRPWSWPILFDAVNQFESRVTQVVNSIDTPFLAAVGIHPNDSTLLPRTMVDALWRGSPDQSKEIHEVLFRDLAEPGRGIVRRKDVVPEHAVARVLASRVGTWLNGFVLGGQEVLVDAPHLVLRYPSLFGVDGSDLGPVERTVSIEWGSGALDESKPLADARFPNNVWLNRPAWWWRHLQSDRGIAEVSNPFDVVELPVVFCEDRSRFLPRSAARSFKADLGTPFDRRWIGGSLDTEDVIYLPADRLL